MKKSIRKSIFIYSNNDDIALSRNHPDTKQKSIYNLLQQKPLRPDSVGKIIKNSRVSLNTPNKKCKHERITLGMLMDNKSNKAQDGNEKTYQFPQTRELELKYNEMFKKYESKKQQIVKQLNSVKEANSVTLQYESNKQNEVSDKKKSRIKKNISKLPIESFPNNSQILGDNKLKFEVDKIINRFQKQIQLENQLRTFKNKINRKNQAKIKEVLSSNYKLPQESYKLQFQQFDPYAQLQNVQQSGLIIKNITQAYLKCEQHWNQLKNIFSKQAVKEFFDKIDYQKKQCINLKILTRQLGLFMNKNLRDRDVFRIFKRFGQQNLKLETMTLYLCK